MSEGISLADVGARDEFARVDLVSNHTVFAEQEHYRALLRGEDLPVETFSAFIHEATHHWCFISPVAMALSLQYLSVAKRALHAAMTDDESEIMQTLDDLCVFDVAVAWLRPLSEGLAQFAEYDIVPNLVDPSGLISPPLTATLRHLFNLRRRMPDEDDRVWRYELADEIRRWRLSKRTIDRKSELLLQPIASSGSAYLLGYLAVKQLWRNAQRFYEELKDADVFMTFLRYLVFADYALVAEILDRSRPAFDRALRVGRGIHERLQVIRLMTFDEDVSWQEWEEVLTPRPIEERRTNWDFDRSFAALDTEQDVQRGKSLLVGRLREVVEPLETKIEAGGQTLAFPPDIFWNLMWERHLMWLGDAPAHWISTGPQQGKVAMDGAVIFDEFKLTNASGDALDELRLDMYIDLYDEFRLTTFGTDRGVFAFAAHDPITERAQAALDEAKLDRHEIAVFTSLFPRVVRAYTCGTNYTEAIESFWSGGARDLLDSTYRDFAFDFDEDARAAVTDGGIAGILENDGDLVRGVAALSLAASAGMTPETFVEMCDLPIDPFDVVARVATLWPAENLPLAAVGRDGFLRSAF